MIALCDGCLKFASNVGNVFFLNNWYKGRLVFVPLAIIGWVVFLFSLWICWSVLRFVLIPTSYRLISSEAKNRNSMSSNRSSNLRVIRVRNSSNKGSGWKGYDERYVEQILRSNYELHFWITERSFMYFLE